MLHHVILYDIVFYQTCGLIVDCIAHYIVVYSILLMNGMNYNILYTLLYDIILCYTF